ncbi:MAG: dephospho-CoA kinase [Ornithinimicrobium sp.]
MLRVGLSGGIGSGKSTVAQRLADLGAVIVDSDRIAREVVAPGTPGLAQVRRRFGSEVVDAEGALDRPALGEVVFAEESARRDLEAITHPLIERRTAELIAMAGAQDIVVHDVPLLVEKGMGAAYHLVVIVDAPQAERMRRLTQERGMSEESARSRIRSQADDAARRRAADVWLENSSTHQHLCEWVDHLWGSRLVPFERNVRTQTPARPGEELAIVAPDPSWPAEAERLISRLERAWGADASEIDINHIGSTAIPGMPAKNVIDLQLVVDDPASLDEADRAARFAEAGWVTAPGSWWDHAHGDDAEARYPKRMMLGTDPARATNLHVRPRHSPAGRRALLFRDWMDATAPARREYATLKADLEARFGRVDDYAEAKEPWFASVFPRAERWAEHTGWQAG